MISAFKSTKQTNNTSADVVDGHLVLSLLNAQEPKVWRMALDKIGTASFEIKNDEKSSVSKLVLKPKKGTAEIIAAFDTQEEALVALTSASNALQKKENKKTAPKQKTKNEQIVIDTPQKSGAPKWLMLLFFAAIVVGLYLYLSSLIPQNAIELTNTSASSASIGEQQPRTGVPMSADDFLSGR